VTTPSIQGGDRRVDGTSRGVRGPRHPAGHQGWRERGGRCRVGRRRFRTAGGCASDSRGIRTA
jgi:hypothetical protein